MEIPTNSILPTYLKNFEKEALEILDQNLVKDIEFSGSTYQVLVEDPKLQKEFWVFLQLDGKSGIRDGFCSCEHSTEMSGCIHLAGAYLSLFNGFSQPIHQRFSRSLWNQLCKLYEARFGGDSANLEKVEENRYSCRSRSGKIVFDLHAQSFEAIQYLQDLLFKEKETEETSLKFSNLSPEEISSWKKGNPHPQLRYDLSYWCDLAKWLMKKQEDHDPYEVTFRYSKSGLPNWIQVNFEDLHVGFSVSQTHLSCIVEALNTVKSPLKIHYIDENEIASIHYDKQHQSLQIVAKAEKEREKKFEKNLKEIDGSIAIEGWVFIPGDGFYAEGTHDLLKTPILHGEDIPYTLSEHTRLISSLITNCPVHIEPTHLSYHLYFDPKWNLHISAYLFVPGDLHQGDSWLMGEWAYLDDEGFFAIEGNRFDNIEMYIPVSTVSDFVTQNRVWLNTMEGFHTHIRSYEYQLSYEVNANKRLTFHRNISQNKNEWSVQDFGAWVYVQDQGFFSKAGTSFNSFLKPGISLSAEQIPLFIKMNYEELSLIPHFFNTFCPISKVGVKITLSEKQKITVLPEYVLAAGFEKKKPLMFDHFVFIEGIGFYELPLDLRIPEKFQAPLELEGEDLYHFLRDDIHHIRKMITWVDPRLQVPESCRLVTDYIKPLPDRGRGWYQFRLYYQTEKGLLPAREIRQEIQKKRPFLFSKAGLFELSQKRYDWLRHLSKDRFEKKSDLLVLSTLDFIRLNAFEPVDFVDVSKEGDSEKSLNYLNELVQLNAPTHPDISGLKSHLRPYQEVGLHWLWFLYSQNLSGLLCDDMGLGKTHQAMALLAGVTSLFQQYAEGTTCHYLIICPTSVIYHWQDKLKDFLPKLRVCTYYDAGRSLEGFHEQYDVLLTSYGILRNEKDLLSKMNFEVAIFDEIPIAKNSLSRVYQSLKLIKAQMKLGLTGTPIENHLRELKSLFDIVLPTYFPGEQEYREFFVRPIEKEGDPHRKQLLNRLINPFILRRKKENVLTDLPEKVEEVSFCDLSNEQSQLYSELLLQRRHHLLEELQDSNHPIPYLHIFALLSSLKQICDHPAVYLKNPAGYQEYQSGKWNLFLELLREARESQQKVVIFSQYLGMLDIIELYLKEHSIGFASLRGSTLDRREQLLKFNTDPECEVFVGSLHAAGLGVDLTAGSVVIHYDRWWNAARENQATDRVHRIGQTRGVQVFKFVCKGTFEEKIDAMISRKGRLMEDIVGIDDQTTLKKFSRNELIELLDFSNVKHEVIVDEDY